MSFEVVTVTQGFSEGLVKTIESLRKHRACVSRHLIISNHSFDDAELKLVLSLTDVPLEILLKNDSGLYDGLNNSLDEIAARYFIFLHAGDKLDQEFEFSGKLENALANSDIVFCNAFVRGDAATTRFFSKVRFLSQGWRCGILPPHTGVFYRTSVFEKVGEFDAQFKVSGDIDWMLRALSDSVVSKRFLPSVRICEMEPPRLSGWKLQTAFSIFNEDIRAFRNNGVFVLFVLIKKFLALIEISRDKLNGINLQA